MNALKPLINTITSLSLSDYNFRLLFHIDKYTFDGNGLNLFIHENSKEEIKKHKQKIFSLYIIEKFIVFANGNKLIYIY